MWTFGSGNPTVRVEGFSTGSRLARFLWYVASALAGLENTAIHHLSRDGITAYSPVVDRFRLFPGYVFVELASPTEAGVVNRTRGIARMLPVHTVDPLPLPVNFVDDLRSRIAGGEFDDESEDELLRRYVPDDEVIAISGPFRDTFGRFSHYRKGSGVILSCLLGRKVPIEIPLHQLAKRSQHGGPESRSAAALAA